MSDPFVGEIRMFGGNYAPRGWALAEGQLMAVSQNDALFSLYGTIYGGDGRTTFGLPDLRGRIPIHHGQGPGLSNRRLGQKGGAENVTLTVNQLPSHTHTMQASTAGTLNIDPAGNLLTTAAGFLYSDQAPDANMNTDAITGVGGSRSHTNLQPFLCISFIVSLFGIYPSRT